MMVGNKAHPGFKAVQSKIQGEGYSKKAAGAILAASTRNASAKAKEKNPALKNVKGASKSASKAATSKPTAKTDHLKEAARLDVVIEKRRADRDKHLALHKEQALKGGAQPQVNDYGGVSVPMRGAKK